MQGFGYERSDERVVGAAEDDYFGGTGVEGFAKVDAEDFAGDGVVDPAFFDERDEEWAGLLGGVEAAGLAVGAIGVGLDRGCRGEDEGICGGVVLVGHLDDGVDYAGDRNGDGGGDLGQGEGGGGVAGDDEVAGTLLVEELCALYCISCDGGLGFGAVGETGGVA